MFQVWQESIPPRQTRPWGLTAIHLREVLRQALLGAGSLTS